MKNTKSGSTRTLVLAALGAFTSFAVLACSGSDTGSPGPSPGSSTVGTNEDALEANLLTCGETARACKTAANGDATAEQACEDQFTTCAADAQAAAQQARDALHGCFETARTCFKASVADGGSPKACGEALRACIEQNAPARPKPACGDAGASFHSCIDANTPPCVRTMRDHMRQGGDLRMCAHEARQCIGGHHGDGGAIPEGDGGGHFGGGHAEGDGGAPKGWPMPTPGDAGGGRPWPGRP